MQPDHRRINGNETDDGQTLENGRGAALYLWRIDAVTLGSDDLGVKFCKFTY